MSKPTDPTVSAVFQPDPDQPVRALVVAGACGNVGFGKLGQFARLLGKHGVPVVALDLSEAVEEVPQRLREAFGKRFSAEEVDAILSGVRVVRGTIDDLPTDLRVGFVFEAIPERLNLKRPFYEAVRRRDPDAYIFSATSGITTRKLFEGIEGAERSGVLHPFFPHLTNKLWELPVDGAITGKDTLATIRKLFGRLGMNLVEVGDVPGFAADRIFCGMMLEAVRIHVDTGMSPAQVDDACRTLLGTSPFFVHNLIAGANYLSAHTMQLTAEEVDSSLFTIPDAWQPYIDDPHKQWPYERGQKASSEQLEVVRTRMLGMLFSLTAYMLEHGVARHDQLNFLCENALAFREGTPALIKRMGFDAAQGLARTFLDQQQISRADEVAPLAALDGRGSGWQDIYTSTAVHGGVGLLSLKRLTLNHVFVDEIGAAYDRLAADDAVKAIVVAPDGALSREFGHGADPNCFVPALGNADAAAALVDGWKQTLARLRSGKPTVAALVGRVLGGGFELACNCHARIAAEGTKIAQPEPTVGVVPGLGGCHHIHRFSKPDAYGRINEILLTGHMVDASEAVGWGAVTRTVPVKELPGASMAYAAALAAGEAPMPAFREGGAEVTVNREVDPRNQQGIPHDAELRELIATTIERANAVGFAEGTRIEGEAAAKAMTMSAAKIGVPAMLRGKPPQFEHPLG